MKEALHLDFLQLVAPYVSENTGRVPPGIGSMSRPSLRHSGCFRLNPAQAREEG
jgi:hypothetical protein